MLKLTPDSVLKGSHVMPGTELNLLSCKICTLHIVLFPLTQIYIFCTYFSIFVYHYDYNMLWIKFVFIFNTYSLYVQFNRFVLVL